MPLLRSFVVSVAIVAAYFTLPMTPTDGAGTLIKFVVGIGAVITLLAWQIREIMRSPHPLARAIGALATSGPLFLMVFAATYYLMGQSEPGTWSEPLTRLDAVYFTMTTFATVGFGDISPASQAARAVTTVQMVANLIFVGLIARVILGAAQEGMRRQSLSRRQ